MRSDNMAKWMKVKKYTTLTDQRNQNAMKNNRKAVNRDS